VDRCATSITSMCHIDHALQLAVRVTRPAATWWIHGCRNGEPWAPRVSRTSPWAVPHDDAQHQDEQDLQLRPAEHLQQFPGGRRAARACVARPAPSADGRLLLGTRCYPLRAFAALHRGHG
jgi:hypothetical protein